jgi:hypothetical protein
MMSVPAGTARLLPGYAYRAPDAETRAGLLLGSPSGRMFLAGCLGRTFGHSLTECRRRDAAPEEARAAVRAAVARGDWLGLLDLDELGLLAAVAGAHPGFGHGIADAEGTRAQLAQARRDLRPVADALVSAPAARRWWEPVARADQRFLEWDGWPRLTGPAVQWAVRDSMTAARAENARGLRWAEQHGAPARDCLWSVPEFAVQSMTTGGLGDLSAIALARFEDLFTPLEETGATVWSVRIAPQARVLEIAGPADWQALVSALPQDVTGTHDGEWRAHTGLAGPWRLPDWEQVMEHYDGVHLTIGGYLACRGLALPAGGGHTMLTGWLPDATIWLRDVATGQRRLGHWQGDPHGRGTWDDLRDAFAADG